VTPARGGATPRNGPMGLPVAPLERKNKKCKYQGLTQDGHRNEERREMNKFRIVRKHYASYYGDASEGFSWSGLVSEIAENGLGKVRFINHQDKGHGGTKQLTKNELYDLLKAVAAHCSGKPN
jgi:hypothetical protein